MSLNGDCCNGMADGSPATDRGPWGPRTKSSLAEYRRVVGGAVATMIGEIGRAPGTSASGEAPNRQGSAPGWIDGVSRWRYPAQGAELPAIRLEPKTWNYRVVVWIDRPAASRGAVHPPRALSSPSVQTLLEKGFAVARRGPVWPGRIHRRWQSAGQSPNRSKVRHGWFGLGSYAGLTFGYNPALFSG